MLQGADAFIGNKATSCSGGDPTVTTCWIDEEGELQEKEFTLNWGDLAYDNYIILDTCNTICSDLEISVELQPFFIDEDGLPIICADADSVECCYTIPAGELAHSRGDEPTRKEVEIVAALPNRGYASIALPTAEPSETVTYEMPDFCMDPYDPDDSIPGKVTDIKYEEVEYKIEIEETGHLVNGVGYGTHVTIEGLNTSFSEFSFEDFIDPTLVCRDADGTIVDCGAEAANPDGDLIYTENPEVVTTEIAGCEQIGRGKIDSSENITQAYIPISMTDKYGEDVCEMPLTEDDIFITWTAGALEQELDTDGDGVEEPVPPIEHYCEKYGEAMLMNAYVNYPQPMYLSAGGEYLVTETKKVMVYDPEKRDNGLDYPEITETITESQLTIPEEGFDVKGDSGYSRAFSCEMVTGDCLPLEEFVTLSI
jgi:hypothetical protein